jgi:hypothetical protein
MESWSGEREERACEPRSRERKGGPVSARRAAALLVLEDGRTFRGEAYGCVGETFGEAVFTTAMTGYQETLTDPSYHRQIVVQTAPHIGNTGVNDDDDESGRIWVAGYVVRDPARTPSNWRATAALEDRLAGSCGRRCRVWSVIRSPSASGCWPRRPCSGPTCRPR